MSKEANSFGELRSKVHAPAFNLFDIIIALEGLSKPSQEQGKIYLLEALEKRPSPVSELISDENQWHRFIKKPGRERWFLNTLMLFTKEHFLPHNVPLQPNAFTQPLDKYAHTDKERLEWCIGFCDSLCERSAQANLTYSLDRLREWGSTQLRSVFHAEVGSKFPNLYASPLGNWLGGLVMMGSASVYDWPSLMQACIFDAAGNHAFPNSPYSETHRSVWKHMGKREIRPQLQADLAQAQALNAKQWLSYFNTTFSRLLVLQCGALTSPSYDLTTR